MPIIKPIIQSGRSFTAEDIMYAQQMVRRLNLSRRELAETLCEHWNWFTASGGCKKQACLALLKQLENKGLVTLPLLKFPGRRKEKIPLLTARTEPKLALACSMVELGDVVLLPVRDKEQRDLFNEYVERYHYLGHKKPFGNILRYFITAKNTLLGCVVMAGAAKSIAVRDQWIGWNRNHRMGNLPWVVNNTRFLIFPWVNVPNLASHVLGKLARQIREDCHTHWRYAPLLLETFVDPKYYRGTCYKAANWIYLGETSGYGHYRPGKIYQTTPKMVFVYPLVDEARHQLSTQNLIAQQGEILNELN